MENNICKVSANFEPQKMIWSWVFSILVHFEKIAFEILLKGIGGGVSVENEVLSDSESSRYALSGTFYGIEKACSVAMQWCVKVDTYAHFCRKMYGKMKENQLKFRLFCPKNAFILAPDHFWNPFFGIVVPFHGLYKRYLGFFAILNFWPISGAGKVKKLTFFGKMSIFWLSREKKDI